MADRQQEDRSLRKGIETEDVPRCPLCDALGTIEHDGLRDTLYGAPGHWRYRRCGTCGLLWQDPMVAESAVANIYAHYYTHALPSPVRTTALRRFYASVQRGYLSSQYGYPVERVWERLAGGLLRLHPGRKADVDFNAIYLPAASRGRLLDVGCGRGETMEGLASRGWDVQGVDTDPKAVEVARRRGLQALSGTIWSELLSLRSFDVIWMSHVIEHVHRPVAVLRRCRELLGPGRTLVAVTPNSESWGHQVFGRTWRGLEPPRHLHIFSRRALVRAAEAAGFGGIEVRVTIRNARAIHGMSRAIRQAERAGTQVVAPPPTLRDELWQALEWLRTFKTEEDGEELVLIAQTPG